MIDLVYIFVKGSFGAFSTPNPVRLLSSANTIYSHGKIFTLDRDTNKERFVYRFCDEFSESKFPYTCALTLSLDNELDNVYKIEVKHDVDGVLGMGYVKVTGIEALKQTLYAISNGTCLVCAEEFSKQPITCLELYSKTVDMFNRSQRV